MKQFISQCLLLLLLTCAAAFSATPVEVAVSNKTPSINETIELTLMLNDHSVDEAPDFQALTDDFYIVGTQLLTQSHVINGQISAQTTFIANLKPKKPGNIIIPSLNWGGYTSKPITLNVLHSSATKKKSPKTQTHENNREDIFIQTEITPKEAYENSQLIYTVKLFYSIPITDASLSDPEQAQFYVYPKSNQSRYQRLLNDKRYEVIERHYAIFPQSNGQFTLQSPIFTGITGTPVDSVFGRSLRRPRKVTVNGDSNLLDIKPRPNHVSIENWLPAKSITLEDDWTANENIVAVGKPIERNITIHAQGITDAQIPNLHWDSIDNVKIYPEKPQLSSYFDGNDVYSTVKQKVTYIPTKAGSYTIPAIKLSWWKTSTEKLVESSLKQHTIKTSYDAVPIPSTTPPLIHTPIIDTQQSPTAPPIATTTSSSASKTFLNKHYISTTVTFFTGLLFIFSLFFFLWVKFTSSLNYLNWQQLRTIKDSCNKKNHKAMRSHFLTWLGLFNEGAVHQHEALVTIIKQEINSMIYSTHEQSLTEEDIWNKIMILNRLLKTENKFKPNKHEDLPKLYLTE